MSQKRLEKRFGQSPIFITSTFMEQGGIRGGYQFIELTMHARGWILIYCMPPRSAFKGSAPINLGTSLHQDHLLLRHYFYLVPVHIKENGHSLIYSWILSTGWWNGRAPIKPDAIIVIGLLCSSLLGVFIYINR